jgi:hypothetical protein
MMRMMIMMMMLMMMMMKMMMMMLMMMICSPCRCGPSGRRLANAAREIEYGQAAGNFNRVIINDDKVVAYQELKAFVAASYPGHMPEGSGATGAPPIA